MVRTRSNRDVSNLELPVRNPKRCRRSETSVEMHKEEGTTEGNDTNSRSSDCSSDFECNVCMEMAKEPVVTCCGHLFCWPCLYKWLHFNGGHDECPVCKGKVSESSLVPIYGRGKSETPMEKKSIEDELQGIKIPPRPKGNRVEGCCGCTHIRLRDFYTEILDLESSLSSDIE